MQTKRDGLLLEWALDASVRPECRAAEKID